MIIILEFPNSKTHISEENSHSLQAQPVQNVVPYEINLLQVRIPSQKNTSARKMHYPQSGCYDHFTGEIDLCTKLTI